MKLSNRFFALLGLAAALVGCRPEEADIDLPKIKVDGPALTFDAETKLASCALDPQLVNIPLTVNANRDWTAEINWDEGEVPWIAVTPEHGLASDQPQPVTLTVLNNSGYNRNKRVKFTIGYDYKSVDISQAGERGEEIVGTLENPLTVAGVFKYVKSLGADVQSSSEVYVKGKISRIDDGSNFASSGTYGNATFYISDTGTENGEQFYCYRILYLGNEKYKAGQTDIAVGDEVLICGKVVNYRGNTPETVQGTAYLFSLNGAMGGGTDVDYGPALGTGTVNDPFNVSMAYQKAAALTSEEKLENVYVKGKITRVTSIDVSSFGNAEYYIADEGFENSDFLVYRGYYLGGAKFTAVDQIKPGDEVIVYGTLVNFRGTTKEITQGSSIYSLNGKTSGDTPEPPGPSGDAKVVTVAGFLEAAESDTQVYELTGTIGGSVNQTYGNFDLTDETGTIYVYGMTATNLGYGAKNDQSYAYLGLQAGDKIKLRGYRGSFNGQPELVYGWFIEKVEEGSIVVPTGSGTLEDPYTPDGAIAAVANLTWTSNTDYQKTEMVYVKGIITRIANNGTYGQSGTYGNASYWISFDGTEKNEFQIYRSLYFNGEKYTEGMDIQVGDEVVVYGALMNYKGNTPETVAGENWLYSLNGIAGGGGGGGDTPSGNGSGTLEDPYTPAGAIAAVANLTWTSNTDYQKTEKVYVKGKISRIANNGTYVGGGTYGNASYWISADGTENEEFQIYRSLYFNGEKYTSGPDIKVGDEVIVYGALMNYKGNTPETVANENWLYSLNGDTGSGGSGGGDTPSGGDGTVTNPYSVPEAIAAVANLTWTSNTDYQKTEKVYVMGKISRIANNGTYGQSGTYGNASYWISADGTENEEFQIYRSLYFNGEKYTEGTDIKVGDEVIVYGALMNYKGNTPETVANENWLYSLNGKTDGGSGGGGGDDTPSGTSVSFSTNSDAQVWAADSDGTYGSGFSATVQGVKVAYFKHTSSSNPVAPNANHVRVYKNSALSISSAEGKKIKKIVIGCAPNAGTTSYCFDMAGLEGGANAACDKDALTITWSGSASKVVLHANNGQVRMEKITVEFE